jgi:hypothetical protein
MRELGKQTRIVSLCLLITAATILPVLQAAITNAAEIQPRKLTLVGGTHDGADAGTAMDGATQISGLVDHRFEFTVPSGTNVGSIKLEYCTIASGTCTAPTGLDVTNATLGANSGDVSGLTMGTKTANSAILTRSAAAVATHTGTTVRLDSVVNPSVLGTFFVRITTFSSTDATTGAVDAGTVTASTAQLIELSGTMPESLIFCTGATVTANCATTTPGAVTFNQLFSPTSTSYATSQMAASTNAGQGYVITVNGATLTSGANSIPAMSAAAAPTIGVAQFGMNLKANLTTLDGDNGDTDFGAELTTTSDAIDYKGQALVGYNAADVYKFATGDAVANSAYDGASNNTLGPTNSQVYTASYIVNVAGNTYAGTYTTTLTYICTPTF